MQKIFDTIIDSYLENNVGIANHFLNAALASRLRENLVSLYAGGQLRSAGIGNSIIPSQNSSVRSDMIYWLDRSHNDPGENLFFELMNDFISYLNSSCYTGISGYEFHYTMYETGSFYKRHLDQFRNNESRKYSMIMYLNTDWIQADGGELCIHHADESFQTITPLNGKSVFFKSNELEHEVLQANKARMSITGWLKVD